MTSPHRLIATVTLLNIVGLFLLVSSGCGKSSDIDEQSVRENNRAVGLMGQYEYDEAAGIWQSLVTAHPLWTDGQVNLALAILNRQKDGDEIAARQMLQDITKKAKSNVRAQYLAGFLALRAGDDNEARTRFATVIELDPDDAYAWYHLGLSTESLDQDKAYQAYCTAVEPVSYTHLTLPTKA